MQVAQPAGFTGVCERWRASFVSAAITRRVFVVRFASFSSGGFVRSFPRARRLLCGCVPFPSAPPLVPSDFAILVAGAGVGSCARCVGRHRWARSLTTRRRESEEVFDRVTVGREREAGGDGEWLEIRLSVVGS